MKGFQLSKKFTPFFQIEKPNNGKRFVIPDIHGDYETFMALLNKISLRKNDQLFLLGDYLDRGNKVALLLDKILELIKNGYAIFPLRGNHEDMCWQAHLKEYDEETLKLPGYKWGKDIIDNKRNIQPKYVNLISKLPYYYELDNFYLVHAGFDFSSSNPFLEYRNMLWHCNEEEDIPHLNNKTLIHGHSKRSIRNIEETVNKRKPIIGLDNSVYTKSNSDYGNLVCLDLDTYELYIQKSC